MGGNSELPASRSISKLVRKNGRKGKHRSLPVSESHFLNHRKSLLRSKAVPLRHKAKCNDITKLLQGISTIMCSKDVQAVVVLSIQKLLSNIKRCAGEVFQPLRNHQYQQPVQSLLSAIFVVVNMELQVSKFT